MKSNNTIPEAYVIGHVPFLGVTVWLDSHPLIPRPETEYWCEKVIADMQGVQKPLLVLDLFAGSGCVGVAVLKHVLQATVDFGEREERHLATIEKNIIVNGIDPNRARVVKTDVYMDLGGPYDYILANPPYLSRARVRRVQGSVLEHEPREALFADDDGFALIERTIEGLPAHLRRGGQAWIEHEPEHTPRIAVLAQKLNLRSVSYKDQYGLERYSVIL